MERRLPIVADDNRICDDREFVSIEFRCSPASGTFPDPPLFALSRIALPRVYAATPDFIRAPPLLHILGVRYGEKPPRPSDYLGDIGARARARQERKANNISGNIPSTPPPRL